MKNREKRESNQIPRLLRLAFHNAEQGEEVKARENWNDALKHGYVVVPKTEKWFERTIAKGLRDRGLTPASANEPPTDKDSGGG